MTDTAKDRAEMMQLASCPFCGSEGHTLLRGFYYGHDSSEKRDAVMCPMCRCRTPLETWEKLSAQAPQLGETQRWQCAARRQALPEPGECNWPACGCDPYADKVIEALQESGQLPSQPGDGALEALGWRYELAHARMWRDEKPAEYIDWRWCLSKDKPHVPEGSLRNLTPLYAEGVAEATLRIALGDAVVALQGILEHPGDKETWQDARAALPRLQQVLEGQGAALQRPDAAGDGKPLGGGR